MQDTVKRYIEIIMAARQRRRKNAGILLALALLVASGIFWKMRLTGITMSDEACCGKPEHIHSEACLGEKLLICGYPEEGETTQSCEEQPTEYVLLCQQEAHTHGDACHSSQMVLNCGEDHEHTEACYGEEQVLTCTTPEHIHDENCMEGVRTEPVVEETMHIHTDACYETPYICGMEEHSHTLTCYSNPKADLETETDWKNTLPDALDGDRVKFLVDIALSQRGYRESEENFILSEDGVSTKGITRYGQWYGNPYGEWDAMFVSFCLHYAGIEEDEIPYNGGSYAWTVQLGEKNLLRLPGEHRPAAGDLIFFNTDEDNRADHAGIIAEADEEKLTVVEGGRGGCVDSYLYAPEDPSIFAFVQIPEEQSEPETIPGETETEETIPEETNPEPAGIPVLFYTDESFTELLEGTVEMTAYGELPEGAVVRACPFELELPDTEVLWAVQLAAWTAEGEPWEGALTVSLQMPQMYALEEQVLSVIVLTGEEELQKMPLKMEADILTFDMKQAGVFALAAEPRAGVSSEVQFKEAFASGDSTIQLTGDFTVTGPIAIEGNKAYTLDLNGHTLTVNGALFDVKAGGSLTILDDSLKNIAPEDADSFSYTVTETSVENRATGATTEVKQTYTVPVKGRIVGGNAPVVRLWDGGMFALESGVLCNGTGRAINMTGGVANLSGGYIYGFRKTGAVETGDENFGGAVRVSGGTLNLSGTVLAKNEALNGGAVYANSAQVNITGGVISENKSTRVGGGWGNHSENAPHRCGGGGIYATGETRLTMEGGYITNNTAVDEGYFDGGGGVLISGTTRFELNGGYITGNEAAGGGGIRSDWNRTTVFDMNGGFVSGNTARTAEGGGIAITQGGTGEINGGYITNNRIINTVHWGGGGLFCSDGAYLRVYHVLVTENSAGGFGGGVAGCSTGRVYICVKDGGAIYSNSADGVHLSGGGSQKNEDHTYAADSPVFMANGYEDYFCALNSLVEGGMLGNGTANWSGSMDGMAISNVAKDAILEAAYVMGLTSAPTAGDIAAAQAEAKVFVNGNSSYTHGGGILCNGYLLVGDKNPIAVGSRLTLSGTKAMIGGSLADYDFTFRVTDEAGNVVSVGKTNGSGNITFDRLLSFTEELCSPKIDSDGGTADFVYELSEFPDPQYPEITFDGTRYRITATIRREDETLPFTDKDGSPIVKSYYRILNVTVQRSADGGENWENTSFSYTPSKDEQHGGSLKITNGTTYANEKGKTTSLTVKKKWKDTENLPDSITVDLLRDGVVIHTVVLDAAGNWTHTWTNLAYGPQYTVYEHPVPGYRTDYITGDPDAPAPGWYKADTIEEGGRYLLVSADGQALTGNPENGGAYDFGAGSWNSVTVTDGFISPDGITENMQWDAVAIGGKDGLYLKNYPSVGKHYLSYQNTDTVKAASGNTTYASRVESCGDGLRLYKQGSTTDVKYAVKNGNYVKASPGNGNALYLYKLSDGSGQNVITIVNTRTEDVYSLNLTKVDANDSSIVLAGAEFRLLVNDEPLTFREENGRYIYDVTGEVTELVTGENGQLHLDGLPKGTYTLHEVKAPDGYSLGEDRTLTLPDDAADQVLDMEFEDSKLIFELPETGGTGLTSFVFIGLLLMAVPVMICKKKENT